MHELLLCDGLHVEEGQQDGVGQTQGGGESGSGYKAWWEWSSRELMESVSYYCGDQKEMENGGDQIGYQSEPR